jgi:hypothetical protein
VQIHHLDRHRYRRTLRRTERETYIAMLLEHENEIAELRGRVVALTTALTGAAAVLDVSRWPTGVN